MDKFEQIKNIIIDSITFKRDELTDLDKTKTSSKTDTQQKLEIIKCEKKESEIEALQELLDKANAI